MKRIICWFKGQHWEQFRMPCERCGKRWELEFFPNKRKP